jgi:hypothetical protein
MRVSGPRRKPVHKCGKAIGKAGSRIRRWGKRTLNRGRRNDGSKSTKPKPWKIAPCQCGDTTFGVVGSDVAMEYVALQCESCRKDYVFRLRGRKLTMLRQID